MPIEGIEQPEYLMIDDKCRLRKYDGQADFALEWYLDPETVYLVDGIKTPYDINKLYRMYDYLNKHSEVYFIEVLQKEWIPIGDVSFSLEDLPIVIGDNKYRQQGLGKKVIQTLIKRGIELGYTKLKVKEIYRYNFASQKLFTSLGFIPLAETTKGSSWYLTLKKEPK